MSEKRKIQRFNLDEGRIWEVIEGLSPFKTTYTLEEVCEKLNEQQSIIEQLKKEYKIAIDEMVTDYKKLEEENEQLHLAIDDLLSHTSCEEIKKENEQLRKQVKSSETTSDATSNYNAHLESKITTLKKENEQLKKKLESLQKVLHLVECVSDE